MQCGTHWVGALARWAGMSTPVSVAVKYMVDITQRFFVKELHLETTPFTVDGGSVKLESHATTRSGYIIMSNMFPIMSFCPNITNVMWHKHSAQF